MLNKFYISKREINKVKVSIKNPFELTCERITKTPRAFNPGQIKGATENISFACIEETVVPKLTLRAVEYTLKDLFLYMHQTGLYNRQLSLWKAMGSITQCSIFMMQKGLFKKEDLGPYIIDFFIDPKIPSFNAIVYENINNNKSIEEQYLNFKTCLLQTISKTNISKAKGIFYFFNAPMHENFTKKLGSMIDISNPLSKYEAIITGTKDARLNVVNFKKETKDYIFQHIYPELRTSLTHNKKKQIT